VSPPSAAVPFAHTAGADHGKHKAQYLSNEYVAFAHTESDDTPALHPDDFYDLAGVPQADRLEADGNDALLTAVVLRVQQLLNRNGWRLAEDGVFGPQTSRAVADFRSLNGLSETVDLGELLAWADDRGDLKGRPASVRPQPDAAVGAPEGHQSRVSRLERIADSTGFDWRSRGVTIRVGCSPVAVRALGRCP
jgi:hypothetical protein